MLSLYFKRCFRRRTVSPDLQIGCVLSLSVATGPLVPPERPPHPGNPDIRRRTAHKRSCPDYAISASEVRRPRSWKSHVPSCQPEWIPPHPLLRPVWASEPAFFHKLLGALPGSSGGRTSPAFRRASLPYMGFRRYVHMW